MVFDIVAKPLMSTASDKYGGHRFGWLLSNLARFMVLSSRRVRVECEPE
jgi:hypothetical protein